MGKLELRMPDLGKGASSLESQAKALEKRIRDHAPKELRASITVRPYRRGAVTGLGIEYDDRAEQLVYVFLEYPPGSGREECAVPKERPKDRC